MMNVMVTISHNDKTPEMLAAIRRGPCAVPTQAEKVEYLLTRIKSDNKRLSFEKHGLEHVLTYQRRVGDWEQS